MAALVLVSLLQRPGRTTFDTKLDLAVDPAAFLARALHLWNPASTGGELQNQAYGYLFPMGPYFTLCQLVGLPPWIAQRLWCALVLCVAFGGALAVARALRVGSEPARYVAALGYALAPRMLTEIGPLSAEMLPAALLPWVLLPLITVDRIGSPRRAAALSGLAVLCMGGVNGAMVIMALVLPGLWLLTRRWTRAHVELVLWWFVFVVGATLWWILPLLLLGEYSLPFVDYVESATNTTTPTSLFQVLRGTNQWVAYVVEGTPWWPSGFLLIDNPALMLATALLAAVGLFGLARRGLPERLFLVVGVVSGIVLLTIGYVGTLDSPLSETVRVLLDGPLAPLRNVHKFEPGLRLALMMAFAHAVSGRLPGVVRVTPSRVWAARARIAVGFVLVLVVAAPAWLFTLRPGPGWAEVPDYWRSAMTWLGQADRDARTLMVPGTGFGEYTWGKTVDEPAQALATAPWALRSQIPLGSEGNTRLMDAVEDALADGRGAPGLADFLARSGHRFLLLRNDIDRVATGAPPLTVVRAALARSPGITKVAGFGPMVRAGQQSTSTVDLDSTPANALEVYEVRREVTRATAVSTSDVAVVSGGPESVLPLLDSGLLTAERQTVLAGDLDRFPGTAEGPWLVTDGLRHRERNVGRVRDNLSQTLTADEEPRQNRPALDVLPFTGLEHQTVAAYRGIRGVTASSAASFADSTRGTDPSSQPFAAIDGDPYTAWQSSSVAGPVDQWLEVELDTPRVIGDVTLRIVDDGRLGWPVTRVRLTTDSGSVTRDVARGSNPQQFTVTPGLTSRVRVTVLSVAAERTTGNVGIAELQIPGVSAQRAMRTPTDADGAVAGFALGRGPLPRYACVPDGDSRRCDAGLTRFGEEPDGVHRLFRTTDEATYRVAGTVLPAIGGRNPVSPAGVAVQATSTLAGDPAAGPLSAVDGDPTTTWISDFSDRQPTLRVGWSEVRDVTGLRLTTVPGSGAARPTEIDVRSAFSRRVVPVDADGRAEFELTTDAVDIVVTKFERTFTGAPAGITDVEVDGADDLIRPIAASTPFTVPCGSGPALTVDGVRYATAVSGTLADYRDHRPLELRTCRDLEEGLVLAAGEHELRADRSDSFVVQDLWLRPTSPLPAATTRAVQVDSWEVARRELTVGAGDAAVLAVAENANDGWVATVDGRELPRTRVDGWQQAWVLPAGGAVAVSLEFVPDRPYRQGLLIGAFAAFALVVLLAVPVRRRVEVSTRPGGTRWVPVVLAGLLVVLGGMPGVIALLVALLLRTLWPPSARIIAPGGMVVAAGASIAGRLSGHGQEWAYGWLAQGALLFAVAAAVSVSIPWFDQRPRPAADPAEESSVSPAELPAHGAR